MELSGNVCACMYNRYYNYMELRDQQEKIGQYLQTFTIASCGIEVW